ncbi:hypothetical protein [Pseudoalteromonas piratica]|uniref:STAS/SEC14 domain-containing protein n=1 Tax=Pseudoalteromonas piratica TaxID=1348114 RepID=A0A0A7EK74_9GAMM|nr:hypothetical protein [Pseudoalteromonas piratica]AIY66466.1 hypothetical protein OM33_15005 [Pseudoalteromonas piratica]
MAIEHGTFTLKLLPNNIVLADAKGPWNIEAVEHYHHDIAEIVASFNGAPWRHIAILRSETLFMPDVVARLEQHFLWRKKHNVLSDTTILSNSFSENISKQQIHRMFEKFDMPHFFANDLDAALKQINELNAL